MRWLLLAFPLALALTACTGTGDVERIRETDEAARQPAHTPTATVASVRTSATPQQQELLLADRDLLLLIAPDDQDVSDAWGATFVLSAATIEDYGLRLEYDGRLVGLVLVVIELKDTDVAASISVEGFADQVGASFATEDLAIGDRAMRLTRTEGSAVIDSLTFASGRVFARLTSISDRESIVELLRVASSLLARIGPVADRQYEVSAAPISGFTAADIDEERMELASQLELLYEQVLVLHPAFGVEAEFDSDLLLDLWAEVVTTCSASREIDVALLWNALAGACLDVSLAEGVFWASLYFSDEPPNAGASLLTAVHLRAAQSAILGVPWRETFDDCFDRNVQSYKDQRDAEPDDAIASGIRQVCRQFADEEDPPEPLRR